MARSFPASGLGNYLAVGDVAAVDITGSFLSFGFFFLSDTTGGFKDCVAKHGGPANTYQYGSWINGTSFQIFSGNGGSTTDLLTPISSVVTGLWYGIMYVKNGSTSYVWVDGRLATAGASAFSIGNTANALNFGRNANVGSGQWDGLLAHVCIWDAVLTPNEASLFTAGLLNPLKIRPLMLKGYWPLDDFGASGTSMDISKNSNHAVMNGTIGFDTGPWLPDAKGVPIVQQNNTPPVFIGGPIGTPPGTVRSG